MIKLILRMFDLLAPLIRALDVDYAQFRAILEAKLILDTRRRGAGVPQRGSGKPKQSANHLLYMMIFYAFMGMMVAGIIPAAAPLLGGAILHAFLMVMVGLSLIADFSTVLLDTTDNAILQPRPVTARTIFVARVAHILVYLASLSLSLSLASMVAGSASIHPWYALVYLPTMACSVALVVAFANVFYLLVMRVTSPERLRDLLSYVQIALAVVMIGSFQVMPRLMELAPLREFRIQDHAWMYWLPPVWCAAPLDLLVGHSGTITWVLSGLGLGMPLVGMWLVVRVLAPRFGQALLKLDSENAQVRAADGPEGRMGVGRRLGRWLCPTPVQRSTFELIWVLCGRDRQFKARTYPSVAVALIVGLSFVFNHGRTNGSWPSLDAIRATRAHLYVLYMLGLMVLTTLQHLRFSPQYEAAWVYFALPIARPGEVLLAALKAVLIRFVLPAYLVVAAVVLAIWGSASLGDVGFAFVAIIFMSVFEAAFLARTLPFSEAFGAMEGAGRVGKTMGLMIVPGVIGVFHYVCGPYPVVLAGALVVLVALTWWFARRYGRMTWEGLSRAASA